MLIVAATERELALLDGAETFCCGIGPVEAGLQTARRIEEALTVLAQVVPRLLGG